MVVSANIAAPSVCQQNGDKTTTNDDNLGEMALFWGRFFPKTAHIEIKMTTNDYK